MPRVRLKVTPSGGIFSFTERYPDARFAILSAYPTDEELLVIFRAEMDDPTELVDFFEGSSFVRGFEVKHLEAESVVVGYSLPFVPPPIQAIFAAGELPRFPVEIKDGALIAEMTTSHERLSEFKSRLEATQVPFEVISLTQSESSYAILTDRQREFVAMGLKEGYYDTPRQCTLTELAETLDVSPATVSKVLHRAEEKLVKDFFPEIPIPEGN